MNLTTNYSTFPPTPDSLTTSYPTHSPSGARYLEFLNSYAAIFVVVLGVIGNCLSITVLLAVKSLRTTSTGILLTILAFADNGALLIGLLPVWIKAVFNVSLYEVNVVVCKFRYVFMYFSLQYSSSVLVLIAIERFVSVYNPAKANEWFSLKRTGIIAAGLGIFLFLLNSHWFATMEIETTTEASRCSAPESSQYFVYEVWVWIDLLIYALIPWVLLSVCNVAIVLRVRNLGRRLTLRRLNSGSSASRRSKLTSMTAMLLVVNTSFLITTMPFAIYVLCLSAEYLSLVKELIYESLYLLSYINNAINFFLYVISGVRFRAAMMKLLRRGLSYFAPNRSSSTTTNEVLTSVNSRQRNNSKCTTLI
ncbi:kappa-type opioid receptor-like [Tubulanus polymorphus]|uniref:kappa-type opioid receptor-like n=1 Tax=Tubulanus polymorphus TaxID=672921 RepID=UPI003DA63DAF